MIKIKISLITILVLEIMVMYVLIFFLPILVLFAVVYISYTSSSWHSKTIFLALAEGWSVLRP